MTEEDAVAEAWASIDGKLSLYMKDKSLPKGLYIDGNPAGYYLGYKADAAELIRRIAERGYKLVSNK